MVIEFKGIPPFQACMPPVRGPVERSLNTPHLSFNDLHVEVASHAAIGAGCTDNPVGLQCLDGVAVM